jgi:hypothetical protein
MACRTGKSFAERANRSGNFSNRSRKFQIARAAGKSFAQVSNRSRKFQTIRAIYKSFARLANRSRGINRRFLSSVLSLRPVFLLRRRAFGCKMAVPAFSRRSLKIVPLL